MKQPPILVLGILIPEVTFSGFVILLVRSEF